MGARRSLVGVTCSYWQRRAAVAPQAWMGLNTHGTKSLKLINTHSPFQRHWSEPDCRQPAASCGPWRRPCCEPVPPSAYLIAEWRQRGPGTRGGDEEVSLLEWLIVALPEPAVSALTVVLHLSVLVLCLTLVGALRNWEGFLFCDCYHDREASSIFLPSISGLLRLISLSRGLHLSPFPAWFRRSKRINREAFQHLTSCFNRNCYILQVPLHIL